MSTRRQRSCGAWRAGAWRAGPGHFPPWEPRCQAPARPSQDLQGPAASWPLSRCDRNLRGALGPAFPVPRTHRRGRLQAATVTVVFGPGGGGSAGSRASRFLTRCQVPSFRSRALCGLSSPLPAVPAATRPCRCRRGSACRPHPILAFYTEILETEGPGCLTAPGRLEQYQLSRWLVSFQVHVQKAESVILSNTGSFI